MKLRNGFVSNSSSASCIVYWRLITEDAIDKEGAMNELMGDCVGKNYLLEHTTSTSMPNTFKTLIWTAMCNDIDDFGPEIAYMIASLAIKPNAEIISSKIEWDY